VIKYGAFFIVTNRVVWFRILKNRDWNLRVSYFGATHPPPPPSHGWCLISYTRRKCTDVPSRFGTVSDEFVTSDRRCEWCVVQTLAVQCFAEVSAQVCRPAYSHRFGVVWFGLLRLVTVDWTGTCSVLWLVGEWHVQNWQWQLAYQCICARILIEEICLAFKQREEYCSTM
jgi:hypothetical protein